MYIFQELVSRKYIELLKALFLIAFFLSATTSIQMGLGLKKGRTSTDHLVFSILNIGTEGD